MPELEPDAVTLQGGTKVTIRHIRPDDAARLQTLFARLSPETIFFRFLGLRKELSDREARQLAGVDQESAVAFVATCRNEGQDEIIAVARYAIILGTVPPEAEAAIVVQDSYQGRGLGTILMDRLVTHARMRGINAFRANVHPNNTRILGFIRHGGLSTRTKFDPGGLEIRIGLETEPDLHCASRGFSGAEDAEIGQERKSPQVAILEAPGDQTVDACCQWSGCGRASSAGPCAMRNGLMQSLSS